MRKAITLLIAVISMVGLCGFASATPIGDIELGDSWGQLMQEDAVSGTYNYLQAMIYDVDAIAPALFQAPAFRNLPSGWTVLPTSNSVFASASGPSIASTTKFYMWMTSSVTPDVTIQHHFAMTVQAYSGTTQKETYDLWWNADGFYNSRTHWDGSLNSWRWDFGQNSAGLSAPVPEPMSIILGIMGLSSVAGLRKLRKS